MTAMATSMMNNWMKKANVAKLSELLEMAQEMGVRLIACQMTMDVMGIKKEDLIDGIEIGGAATFLKRRRHRSHFLRIDLREKLLKSILLASNLKGLNTWKTRF